MQETDNGVEWLTDAQTVGEADFVITTTPTGFYRIEVRGQGMNPKITEEKFTNLSLAKRAIQMYLQENEVLLAKKALIKEGVERRKKLNENE